MSSEEDTAGRKPSLNTGVWQAVTLTELGSQGRGGKTRDLLKAVSREDSRDQLRTLSSSPLSWRLTYN